MAALPPPAADMGCMAGAVVALQRDGPAMAAEPGRPAMPGLPIRGPMSLGCAEAPAGTATIARPGSKAWIHERRRRFFIALISRDGQGRSDHPKAAYASRVPGNRSAELLFRR